MLPGISCLGKWFRSYCGRVEYYTEVHRLSFGDSMREVCYPYALLEAHSISGNVQDSGAVCLYTETSDISHLGDF